MRNRLLVVMPISYKKTKDKGTLDLLKEYGCNGFFDQVIIWGFNLNKSSENNLDNIVKILETKKKFNNKILDFFYYIWIGIGLIKRYKINIIRATEPSFRGIVGLILAKLFKLPYCISIHADYDKCFELAGSDISPVIGGSRRIARLLEKFVLKFTDLIMPIRESLANKMIEYGVPENKIKIIPHGIDLNDFLKSGQNENIYKKFEIPENKKILSFAARLSNENYIYDVIELSKKLKCNNISDLFILVAGDGDEYEAVKKIIIEEQLGDFIKLIGFQTRNVISAIRQQSYINLSLMGGYSLIEACSAGKPIIAYNVEWHYELVKNNTTGFLIEEHNIEELFNSVMFLIKNEEKSFEYGKNARQLVFSKHNIDKSIEAKIQCYKQLLSEKC